MCVRRTGKFIELMPIQCAFTFQYLKLSRLCIYHNSVLNPSGQRVYCRPQHCQPVRQHLTCQHDSYVFYVLHLYCIFPGIFQSAHVCQYLTDAKINLMHSII